jgi:hypothetical protein
MLKRDLLLCIKLFNLNLIFFVRFDSEIIHSQSFIITSDINDKCSPKK